MRIFSYIVYVFMNVAGTAVFCYRFKRRKLFILRLILSLAVLATFEGLRAGIKWDENVVTVLNYIGWGISWFLLAGTVFISFECKLISAVFCATCGYCVQHITNRLNTIITTTFKVGFNMTAARISCYVFCAVIVLAAVYFFYYSGSRKRIQEPTINRLVQFFVSLFLLFIIQFVEQKMSGYTMNLTDRFYRHTFSAVFTVIVLMLEFNLVAKQTVENENVVLRQIMEQEKKNYEFAKEMIEAVNIKCHDLKHVFATLQNQPIKEDLERIRESVDNYDAIYQTGNKALDTVFTTKSMSCASKEIELSIMADVGRFSFMDDIDIYSLFGNILDNCIEAVEKLEPEKRVVNISVKNKESFLLINADNYCAEVPDFKDGLPQTTKQDGLNHGFGLLSIKKIVQKYQGNLDISVEDGIFSLEILFPIGA